MSQNHQFMGNPNPLESRSASSFFGFSVGPNYDAYWSRSDGYFGGNWYQSTENVYSAKLEDATLVLAASALAEPISLQEQLSKSGLLHNGSLRQCKHSSCLAQEPAIPIYVLLKRWKIF
jgi:hypothetical protein